ncbi:MAG: FAD-binding oxidoreductase [Nitrospiraceae bacterium]
MDILQAEVIRTRDLTHDVREIELRLMKPQTTIQFKAGQFISFEMAKPGFPLVTTRPYSIASPPSLSDHILLVLNLVVGGSGSTYLFNLRERDVTQFKGPAGSFYVRDDHRDLLLVATGTGIAPFRSMVLSELEKPISRQVKLVWGLRSQRDLYYQEEFADLSRTHPRFTFVTALSRPDPGWTGVTGRVTTYLETHVDEVKNVSVYLCGNGGMIKDVTTTIRAKGLCPIYREQYYEG